MIESDHNHPLPNFTLGHDQRLSIAQLYVRFDQLMKYGWHRELVCVQRATTPVGLLLIPIFAYRSPASLEIQTVNDLFISGIHGREVAGPEAIATVVPELILFGRVRSITLLPCCNAVGRTINERYSPNGKSVADADHLLQLHCQAACQEAAAIGDFLNSIPIGPRTRVIDLHEDPVYEDPEDKRGPNSTGTYIYVDGHNHPQDHDLTLTSLATLAKAGVPLVRNGQTRFGERINSGMVVFTDDGSMDQYLAVIRGASPVITTEILVTSPNTPSRQQRVYLYSQLLQASFRCR